MSIALVALALIALFRALIHAHHDRGPGCCLRAPQRVVVLTVGARIRLARLTGAMPAGRSEGCTAPAPARRVAGCEVRVAPFAPGWVSPEVRQHDRARGTKEFWILSSPITLAILVAPAALPRHLDVPAPPLLQGGAARFFLSALEGSAHEHLRSS
jgi:hypothetical protein